MSQATAIDSDKSFDVAILEQVIRATYFSPDGRGRPSLAAKHPDLFRSSAYYSQHEKEVPEAMVGMACAGVSTAFHPRCAVILTVLHVQISEAIRRWSTGEYKRIDISTTAAEDQYRTCIDVLQAIHENSPECYHRVLHRLYLGATYVVLHLGSNCCTDNSAPAEACRKCKHIAQTSKLLSETFASLTRTTR